MKELITVLKATMTGTMNVFKINKNKKKQKNKLSGIMLIIFLTCTMMFVFGMYAAIMAEPLHEVGLTSIVVVIFALVSTVLVFIQGVYRAEGILFDAKDNDLLFSMPIKRKTIFAARIIKLTAFEYIWTFISMVPVFAVYAYFEKPEITFYITALIMFITIPIIPIIVASIIAYIIQGVTSRFKFKNIVQFVFNLVFILGICALSFSLESFMTNIVSKAQSISDMISKIYYPVGVYGQCIDNFSLLKILGILGINLLVFLGYIYIFSLMYFNIVSKLSERHSKSNYKIKELKSASQGKALLIKELKKYFGSYAYVLNTLFGEILLVLAAGYQLFTKNGFQSIMEKEFKTNISEGYLPMIVLAFVMFVIAMSSTTASSISMEGKSLWLTKSLPVSEKKIFLSKIMVNLIVTIPLSVISFIVLGITLKFTAFYYIVGVIEIILLAILVAVFGLIVNLKYPKFDARSDTEIVKQSMSAMISVYAGMILVAIPIILYIALDVTKIKLFISLVLVAILVAILVLWKVLMTFGVKKFRELN